jgi:hypothetical protein
MARAELRHRKTEDLIDRLSERPARRGVFVCAAESVLMFHVEHPLVSHEFFVLNL